MYCFVITAERREKTGMQYYLEEVRNISIRSAHRPLSKERLKNEVVLVVKVLRTIFKSPSLSLSEFYFDWHKTLENVLDTLYCWVKRSKLQNTYNILRLAQHYYYPICFPPFFGPLPVSFSFFVYVCPSPYLHVRIKHVFYKTYKNISKLMVSMVNTREQVGQADRRTDELKSIQKVILNKRWVGFKSFWMLHTSSQT